MMLRQAQHGRGRLSTLAAAFVIARRDFVAILFSRTFIFFLLGPLFPLLVGGLAGGIGKEVRDSTDRPVLGVAMLAPDADAFLAARARLAPQLGRALPELTAVARLAPGQRFDAARAMQDRHANLAAIVSGSPAAPVLTGPGDRLNEWRGPVSALAAEALRKTPGSFPPVTLASVQTSRADQSRDQVGTAQAAQLLLFLLTTMLAGMVLSTLVEEKGNKIIEVLAAAIPMDAVFFGKLIAMLAVSLIGIATWGVFGGALRLLSGQPLMDAAAPAVGWPIFFALGVTYFAMLYLLLGSVFLAIGSMAQTVREVQTLSMPVTMVQILLFFFAFYAMSKPGSPIELAAIAVPFSSPFAMLARAAQQDALWPHAAAIAWQVFCVVLFVRIGASVFRRRVMKSGPAPVRRKRRWRRDPPIDTKVSPAG